MSSSRNTQFLVLLLLLLQLLNTIWCSCGAGYYHTSNIERPCSPCPSGSFCPGDDKIHPCQDGTISPTTGAASCQSCQSKRSDSYHVYCILSDAPSDATEAVNGVFHVSAANPHWFLALSFTPSYGYKFTRVQFTLVEQSALPSDDITIYASTKTGKPDEDNYEYRATGVNATIAVPGGGSAFVPVYFTIRFADKHKSVALIGKQYNYLDIKNDYHITQDVTNINTTVQLAWWEEAAIRLIIDKVPAGAKVNFTVTVGQQASHSPLPFQFSLFHSSLKTIEYPNVNNADVIVRSNLSKWSTASVVATAAQDGPFVVSLSTKTLWDAIIHVHTSMTGAPAVRKVLKFNQ